VAACNALHELEERLSRWLLQSRDLLMSDSLPLTQEFLAQMLGVHRSSVTLVARKLQEVGFISMSRACKTAAASSTRPLTGIFHKIVGWSPNAVHLVLHTSVY
jgi:DNA-binding MurR/RpiR family transcriptional regulator